MEKQMIEIYTDGSCLGNQYDNANGGYGAIVLMPGTTLELAQGYHDTTNNRAELRGCIAALKVLPYGCYVTIYSDSKYVTDAFNLGWIEKWKVSGWRNASKKPVANQDLWSELLTAMESHEVVWQWVKGHADNPMNTHADALAQAAARSEYLLPDTFETVSTIVARH